MDYILIFFVVATYLDEVVYRNFKITTLDQRLSSMIILTVI